MLSQLSKKKFSTLKEYADNFLAFLTENTTLFPESEQEKHFFRTIAGYFVEIKNDIDNAVKTKLSTDKKIADTSVKNIVEHTIKKHFHP